ncbi:SCO2524 family protein [Kineosporia succinea]|uniref:Uncharacterized protein n=1 Tax=Kineosporia succinea TaxID=84632 RepID=A0ABT9PEG8_9ACTN|nr:SCO2524 family protein [Kineosporia succinea]MDP9830789.1 hypothetical protein [Kineosporia succinea]
MLLEPRDQILDIWRASLRYSYRTGEWNWAGNSISDAEQLLCILYPATAVPTLGFDQPDLMGEDVAAVLHPLGNQLEAPRTMITLLIQYMRTYTDEVGNPTFRAGSYIDPEEVTGAGAVTTGEQRDLEIVDSYSMSVSLCLAVLGFLQAFREGVRSRALLAQIEELRGLTSHRLTGALTGLLRSFSVHVFEIDSLAGQSLLRNVNQAREPDRIVADRLSRELDDIRGRLRGDVTIGSGVVADELDNRARLFECGWSWGVIKGAAGVSYTDEVTTQPPGVAEDRPYLYFTGVALDGIEDLFSRRTQILGLLDDVQLRAAQALRLRYDLTLAFWTRVATTGSTGPARIAVEDVPWRTSDGVESEYYTLFVTSMVVQQLADDPASAPLLSRMARIMEHLADRGRITSRPVTRSPVRSEDQALRLHEPGERLTLRGTEELGSRQVWRIANYSSLLFKRAVRISGLLADVEQRDAMLRLSDTLMQHLQARRLTEGDGTGLWDQLSPALPITLSEKQPPSWYHTERVIEGLVTAAGMLTEDLPPSPALLPLATDLLAEAENIFAQEKLAGTRTQGHAVRVSFDSIEKHLERARLLLRRRPGTSLTLVQGVLRELDGLAMARQGPGRGTA